MGAMEPGRRQAFERALNVAGAGNVLMQTMISKVVQQIHLRELGALTTLPRKPGSGNAAYENRRTPPGSGAEWVIDTDAGTEVTGTVVQKDFPYKTLLTRGKVTRFLQAAGRSYGDILSGEITGKSGDHANELEKGLIVGNIAANAKQFDGLITLTQATSSQIVLQTTAGAGDDLTLDKLDETIDKVKGSSQRSDCLIFASFKGRRMLNAALQAQQQFNDLTEIRGGFRVRTYDGIPIVTTTAMPDICTFNGSKITVFSGAATTAVLVVNTSLCWIEELTPVTIMPLAKSDSQFDQFDIFWDGSLNLTNPLGAAILVGLNAA
jgi:hypothetical protein